MSPETEGSDAAAELDRPLPRPVRLTGAGIVYCFFGSALIVFLAAVITNQVTKDLRKQAAIELLVHRIAADHRETEATVTRLWSGIGRQGVVYHYNVDGRSYDAHSDIASEHWQTLQVGFSLGVSYLAIDPSHAYPSADPPHLESLWWMSYPFDGFFLLFGAWLLSTVWREGRLLARGCVSRAVVTRCEATRGRGGVVYIFYYEFPLPTGGLCRDKSEMGRPLPAGSPVTVLYDPDNPRRNSPYPMGLVKVAAS
jgi:hypothetical protein